MHIEYGVEEIKNKVSNVKLKYNETKSSFLEGKFSIPISRDEAKVDKILFSSLDRLQNEMKNKRVVGFQHLPLLTDEEYTGEILMGDIPLRYTVRDDSVLFQYLAVVIG